MFEEHTHQQHISDQLKRLVDESRRHNPILANAAYDLLMLFERSVWQPPLFEEAFGVSLRLKVRDGRIVTNLPSEASEAVIRVLAAYLLLLDLE